MHLISDPNELQKIYGYLPVTIEQAAAMSRETLYSSCHPLRCDLDYSSVTNSRMLSWLPSIVGEMKELRLYVVNCEPAAFKGAPSAFEITTASLPGDIVSELSGANRQAYERVYLLSGRFAIVSPESDWVIFVETDDYAFFSSSRFDKFALFNARWWTREYQDWILPGLLQEEHMNAWDLLYPHHTGGSSRGKDG